VEVLERHLAARPTTGHLEVRAAAHLWAPDELDFTAESDGMHFRGYAAVFDRKSEDLGGFRESIRPTAFRKTLGEQRAIKMFWNHDQGRPLGSTMAAPGRGLLTLKTDTRGLMADVKLPDTSDGRDMAELVRTGIVDSMSFGFSTVADDWPSHEQREVVEARLFEVSPVTGWPAYQDTSASVRSLAGAIGAEVTDLERAARALLGEGELTAEQRELLQAAIRVRATGHVGPVLATYRSRFADLGLPL
jgi:HK97 family phage prohead protease